MEVHRCVDALLSAFHNAAATLEFVKDRRQRRRWMRRKDVEELAAIKLLHKSLKEGEMQCRKYSEDYRSRFGRAFDVGDDRAALALKEVEIALQRDVIQDLHIAKAVESAVLDFAGLCDPCTRLRMSAIRAMEELCDRIERNMEAWPQYRNDYHEDIGPVRPSFSERQRMDSGSSSGSFPSPPHEATFAAYNNNQGSSFQHLASTQNSGVIAVQERTHQTSRSATWSGAVQLNGRETDMRSFMRPAVRQIVQVAQTDSCNVPDGGRLSQASIQVSPLGSEIGSRRLRASNRTTGVSSHPQRASFISALSSPTHRSTCNHERTPCDQSSSPALDTTQEPSNDDYFTPEPSEAEEASSTSSRTAAPRSSDVSVESMRATYETFEDVYRATYAPEVVTKGFEPMLSQQSTRLSMNLKVTDHVSVVHPALRVPNNYEGSPVTGEANSHGFCVGALQTRNHVHEGISIKMVPHSNGQNIPYWSCKLCQFQSTAVNAQTLPDKIFFMVKSGVLVRYRWRFLAKSHIASLDSYKDWEKYKYGCIFCAAEGHDTDLHGQPRELNRLMEHILAKHKASMITPETKEKTRCIVGRVAEAREDWDVNLTEAKSKTARRAVRDLMAAAVTGFSDHGTRLGYSFQ